MTVMVGEPGDLVVPRVAPQAVWEAVSGLGVVAAAVQAAVEGLDGAPGSAVCWSGEAADGYRGVRDRMAGRAAGVARVASAAAGVVLDWLEAAAPAVAALRASAEQVGELRRRIAVNLDAGGGFSAALDVVLQGDLLAATGRWQAALHAYQRACQTAGGRLLGLCEQVPDRSWTGGEQAGAAVAGLVGQVVVDPVTQVWSVTGDGFVDSGRWWDTVTGWPGDTVDGVAAAVLDPAAAGAALIDLDAWRAGHYGAAAASVAALFVPGPRWLGVGRDLGAVRFAKNIADPAAPRPVLQSVQEMIDGVDLDRHEHATLGHTLRRHVDVDDDYLMDRLTHGTLKDGTGPDAGARGAIPPMASRFTDRATAEGAITQALRDNASAVRALEQAQVGKTLEIKVISPTSLGQVMKPAPGGFTLDDGHRLVLRLRKGPQGPYIETAFVG